MPRCSMWEWGLLMTHIVTSVLLAVPLLGWVRQSDILIAANQGIQSLLLRHKKISYGETIKRRLVMHTFMS